MARGRPRAQCMVIPKDTGRGMGRDRDRATPARTGLKWVRPGRAGKGRIERFASGGMKPTEMGLRVVCEPSSEVMSKQRCKVS